MIHPFIAGTVDYTAQEVIENERVKEITFANGGDWGGRHVDKKFIRLLSDVLGDSIISDFIKQHPAEWYDIELSFEQAKTSADGDSSISFPLPIALERFARKKASK